MCAICKSDGTHIGKCVQNAGKSSESVRSESVVSVARVPPAAHHTTVPQRTFQLFIPRLTRRTLSFQPHTWSAHATPQPMPNGT